MSWYTNLLSSVALIPLIVLTGEMPGIWELFGSGSEVTSQGISPLATFAWGSAITVRSNPFVRTSYPLGTG